jgi:glyoxylase-like metal-dependent hydrolase (beta-lactamase superfamily II)
MGEQMSRPLSVSVLNSGYKPIPGGQGWDRSKEATWPARTSTLISGERDAILVDAFLTKSEGDELAEWVKTSGKNPSLIFITHGHADHFFGAGPTLNAFPEAQLVTMSPQSVDEARWQTGPAGLDIWNAWFEGQFDEHPAVPTALPSGELEIEGHAVHVSVAGQGDGVLAAILHVPDIATVCSGDVLYNNIHMWLWNSTPSSRAAWLASMDAVASLNPATIITGHKDPDAPDDDALRILDQSRNYLKDFDQAATRARSASDIIDVMMAKYSSFANPYTLFAAAASQFDI